ncbi:MAG: hypothetical protein MUQ32_03265 [Chloroflexi bacterium]|nr:hypothetical protein [Chloroflexota bacterium]
MAKRFQETSKAIAYRSGTWRRTSSTGASGGHVRYAKAKGATASFTFTGRAVAWVAQVGPGRGAARVYVDGVYRKTVDLHRSSNVARRIVYRISWLAAGKHTISVRVVGTSGHPRVDVDAFVTIR